MRFGAASTRQPNSRLQMSAMIDVVFLLLVFFVMTFRITALEGDIHIEPQQQRGKTVVEANESPLPLLVQLTADDSGELSSVVLNGRALAGLDELHSFVREICSWGANGAKGDELEVVLQCDSRLKYAHVIAASDAVGGIRLADGGIIPLARKLRFAPARDQARG